MKDSENDIDLFRKNCIKLNYGPSQTSQARLSFGEDELDSRSQNKSSRRWRVLSLTRRSSGIAKGSMKQYRNSRGVHVREYCDHFEIHVDAIDPRTNPLGHLIYGFSRNLVAFASDFYSIQKQNETASTVIRKSARFSFPVLIAQSVPGKNQAMDSLVRNDSRCP